MSADIEPIHNTLPWSARAAVGNAMGQVEDEDAVVCIWIDKDGELSYSKANTTRKTLSMISTFAAYMATRAWEVRDGDY